MSQFDITKFFPRVNQGSIYKWIKYFTSTKTIVVWLEYFSKRWSKSLQCVIFTLYFHLLILKCSFLTLTHNHYLRAECRDIVCAQMFGSFINCCNYQFIYVFGDVPGCLNLVYCILRWKLYLATFVTFYTYITIMISIGIVQTKIFPENRLE